jgi:hypothetical protein
MKLLTALSLISILVFGATAQSKKHKRVKKNPAMTTKRLGDPAPTQSSSQNTEKLIAEGTNAEVDKPFLFVARSSETYAELRSFVRELPPPYEIDFSKQIVAAAFGGTKNTGGYSISISTNDGKTTLNLNEPAKNAIVTQIITTPYKIVAIPLEDGKGLQLEVGKNWTDAMTNYQVITGLFEFSGGFAGMTESFQIEGTIGVLKYEKYLTLSFMLTGKGTGKQRKMTQIGSGTIKNGLNLIDVGTLSDGPRPPVFVKGKFGDDLLDITLEPNLKGWNYADAFAGGGKLVAAKIK